MVERITMSKTKRLLSKGEDLTYGDIHYLINRGAFMPDIAEVLGMKPNTVRKYYHKWRDKMYERGLIKDELSLID